MEYVIVFATIFVAAAYLLFRFIRMLKGKAGGCGSCGRQGNCTAIRRDCCTPHPASLAHKSNESDK